MSRLCRNDSPDDEALHAGAIEDAAALWLAECEEGLTPERARAFEAWRRADPRHAAAVARLEPACTLLQKLPLVRAEVTARHAAANCTAVAAGAGTARFPWRWAGALAAAAGLVAGFVSWHRPAPNAVAAMPVVALHSTAAGGYQRVILADGSVVELNAKTEVRVLYSAAERRVTLVTGEAHFGVTPDPVRPFVVSAAGVAVRAVGTGFNVRLADAAVEVLVTHGRVRVSSFAAAATQGPRPGAAAPQPAAEAADEFPLLEAGDRAVVSLRSGEARPRVERVAPAVVRETLAWQERKLVFAETPLRDVIAQFNVRHRTQLVLDDEALGRRPVGGTFDVDNVAAFVRLLESAGDLVAEPHADGRIVLRRAR